MKCPVLAFAALGIVVAMAAPPAAAQKRDKDKKEATSSTEKKKVKSYDFDGDDIDGDLVKPDGEFVDTRRFASHSSLIRIRADFIREVLKSAENL